MSVSTKERLVSVAHGLFYAEGFHSVGLDRVLSEVGISKTAFYNHFESKEDLVLEALRWHDSWWQDEFRKMLRKHGGDRPLDQLRAVASVLEEMFESTSFNGCIFVNVSVEFPNRNDPAHRLAAEHKESMEDILREIAGYAGIEDPGALAQEIAVVLEGAYVTRQVTGRSDVAETAGRVVRALLGARGR